MDGITTSGFDALESRSPEQREARLLAAVAAQIEHAKSKAPGVAALLRHVAAADIRTRDDLARLPVLRKSELRALQQRDPPFGGLVATPLRDLARVYCSPGPIYMPEGRGVDWWRSARALFAAGFRAGDLVANTFNHHMTPGAAFMESGARHLGCVVLPTGIGQPEVQAELLSCLGATGYVGTPSFLKQVLARADAAGHRLPTSSKALVTGEYLQDSLRLWITARGVQLSQCYSAAEIGLIAYEERLPDGRLGPGMVVDESLLVEIVRPGTGDPVPLGEVGEVVVTTLNPDYPLIRFATGDLSSLLPPCSESRRTNMRISGWLGRADQSSKVRGVFVHPWQVTMIAERHEQVRKARLVVSSAPDGTDELTLICAASERNPMLEEALQATARSVIKLRAAVRLVEPDAIANDGTLIEDSRGWDTTKA